MKTTLLILSFVFFLVGIVHAASLGWDQPDIDNVVGWHVETAETNDDAAFSLLEYEGFDGKLLKDSAEIIEGEYVFELPDMTGRRYFRVRAFNHASVSDPSNVVLGIFESITAPVRLRFLPE